MGAAVKQFSSGWRPKGRSTGRARVERLRERLATERDERVLESIRAQLWALDRTWRG